MRDVQDLLRRQAAWQARQRALPWAEKVRMVEAILESVQKLRRPEPPRTPRAPRN